MTSYMDYKFLFKRNMIMMNIKCPKEGSLGCNYKSCLKSVSSMLLTSITRSKPGRIIPDHIHSWQTWSLKKKFYYTCRFTIQHELF